MKKRTLNIQTIACMSWLKLLCSYFETSNKRLIHPKYTKKVKTNFCSFLSDTNIINSKIIKIALYLILILTFTLQNTLNLNS